MIKPQSPCIDCDDRIPGCHSNCKGYYQYKVTLNEYNSMIRDGKKKESNFRGFKIEAMRKAKKK